MKENAKKLIIENVSLEIISKYVNLPIEEIQKLAEKVKQETKLS